MNQNELTDIADLVFQLETAPNFKMLESTIWHLRLIVNKIAKHNNITIKPQYEYQNKCTVPIKPMDAWRCGLCGVMGRPLNAHYCSPKNAKINKCVHQMEMTTRILGTEDGYHQIINGFKCNLCSEAYEVDPEHMGVMYRIKEGVDNV